MNPSATGSDRSASVEQARWFSEEVQPHEAALRGYLRNNFPLVDTDDVVQESYLKLLKARAADKIASTKAYLFSIARNTAITRFQRRRIYSETPVNDLPGWQVLDGRPDPADAVTANQRYGLMIEAVDNLPSRCREVLRLAVCGLSNVEIGWKLGISENTVRVHLGRGIKKCADYLRQRGEHL